MFLPYNNKNCWIAEFFKRFANLCECITEIHVCIAEISVHVAEFLESIIFNCHITEICEHIWLAHCLNLSVNCRNSAMYTKFCNVAIRLFVRFKLVRSKLKILKLLYTYVSCYWKSLIRKCLLSKQLFLYKEQSWCFITG